MGPVLVVLTTVQIAICASTRNAINAQITLLELAANVRQG